MTDKNQNLMNSTTQQVFSPDENVARLRGVLDEVEKVASGGMAHIFKARQPALDRYIVVKKLKEELFANPETLERFRREAKALASVLHQNIAHVYDFVESGRDSFLLMEYIDGIDLSTVIEKVGNLPAEISAAILLNVARGVSYIHAYHLIHRDIKPANIRLTSRGEVKLMDFGIVMDIENTSLTRPGMMVGSPSYLSPEQVLGDTITPSADIFLLGITLYEMVTGTRPFKNAENETVFQRIRETKYIPARKMNSTVPRKLDEIIEKCLRKKVEDRYSQVKDLITDLDQFLGAQKSAHTGDLILKYLDQEALVNPTIKYSEVIQPKKGWKKLNWSLILIGGLALFFGFSIGYFVRKPQSEELNSYPQAKSIQSKSKPASLNKNK